MREQKISILAWVIVGGLAQYGEALGLNKELKSFSGGPERFATIMKPAVEAMRPLRWPADRLDTLAGYLSYHNITLFVAFLCLFGVLQGSKLIRGYEDTHAMELALATGSSRVRVLVDRAIGFAVTILLISLGLGLGTGLTMVACGQSNWYGSIVIFLAGGVAAFSSFALALVVSQLARTYKSASGIVIIVLVVVYVINNVAEEFGAFGNLRYLAPTYYANLSRPLIPGLGTNWGSLFGLAVVSTGFVAVAAVLFTHRDIGMGLLHKSQPIIAPTNEKLDFHLRRFWFSSIVRGWIALVSWTVTTAAFTAMLIFLEPNVAKSWEIFKWLGVTKQGDFETSMQIQYIGVCASLIPPFVSGYIVQQASNWVNELKQGRIEMFLSTPLSWTKLVFERVVAATFGATVITTVSLAVINIGSPMIDFSVDTHGIFRVLVVCIAFSISMSVIASIVVALVPKREAVVVLATYIAASWIISYIAPILGWSVWVQRTSILYAFGTPYQSWPGVMNSAIITFLVIPGFYIATRLANRSPKTA